MSSRILLPGKAQSSPQAVSIAQWRESRIIAYVSGDSLVVLDSDGSQLQVIYLDEPLDGVIHNDELGNWGRYAEITPLEDHGSINTICWGAGNEVFIGSTSLSLWTHSSSTGPLPTLSWSVPLPNSIEKLACSPDGLLIATVAANDRLVKIWKRSLYAQPVTHYDFSYLAHPRAVNKMFWSRPLHKDQTSENVLYTVAADNILRIWSPVHPHETYLLQIWNSINIDFQNDKSCGVRNDSDILDCFLIDNRNFVTSIENAVASIGDTNDHYDNESMKQVSRVAARFSEAFATISRSKTMTVWAIENIGGKLQKSSNAMKIASIKLKELPETLPGERIYSTVCSFPGDSGLTLVLQSTAGKVTHYRLHFNRLLLTSDEKPRIEIRNVWTGQRSPISRFTRDQCGKNFISWTKGNEVSVWKQMPSKTRGLDLRARSDVPCDSAIEYALLIDGGAYAITLHKGYIQLFDVRERIGRRLQRAEIPDAENIICLLQLPEQELEPHTYYIASMTSKLKGRAWRVRTHHEKNKSLVRKAHFEDFGEFELGIEEDLHLFAPVDPLGWPVKISGFLDVFSRDVATSLTTTGVVRSWSAKVLREESQIQWLCTATTATGISRSSLVRANSRKKVALVAESRTKVSIWNSKSNQLEYEEDYGEELIQDLDWTCTPNSQSILAMGFKTRVVLLCQLRYDFLGHGPSWAAFREISLQGITPHPIGDSIWLSSGALVIGAGNQIVVCSREVEKTDPLTNSLHIATHGSNLNDIFEIVESLNGPLPVYHPQFLQQCILYGKSQLVERILVRLQKELRDYHEEIPLDTFLNIPPEDFLGGSPSSQLKPVREKFSYFSENVGQEESEFTETTAGQLTELLMHIAVPRLSNTEQRNLAAIVECSSQVKVHQRSMDENGARYLLFFRLSILRRIPPIQDTGVTFREVAWAYHSESQDILVDFVNKAYGGRTTWPQMRASGMSLWLKDADALRKQFELLARNHYTATTEKNPIDCSLYYLALHKKTVLSGLWRIAGWHKEQTATLKFLSNDFREQKWRAAAKKNAYALMSKHRFEYAAAFFLLADSVGEAVNICFTQMRDMQLAIAIARVSEGDNGPVLKNLLTDRVIPYANEQGDRWLASWAYWMVNRKDLSVRSLISPLSSISFELSTPPLKQPRPSKSKLFVSDDPALIVLYKQIREKSIQTLRGAEKISPSEEFEFVLHTARINDRMGCDILALDLVKNWHFLNADPELRKPFIEAKRHHVRRRSSIVSVDEGFSMKSFNFAPATQPAQVFEEPDMSWAF